MFDPRTLARTLIAGTFIVGGWEAIQNPKAQSGAAEHVVPMAEKMGMEKPDPVQLVTINGTIQFVGGLLLVFGWFPRLAALMLGASLVPSTFGTHRFWETDDEHERRVQTRQALKNASILGGLLMTAVDHGPRPSVFWTTRKMGQRAAKSVGATVDKIKS